MITNSYSDDFFFFPQYKYLINVDGTVAAYRLPYLLAGGSLVLKQESPYYEHFYSDLKEGEHFWPLRRDLSDLAEKVLLARSDDEKAELTGLAGKKYVVEELNPQQIFCYHAVLFDVSYIF